MTHRKDLMKKGYKSHAYGTKKELNKIARNIKKHSKIKYRIVPTNSKSMLPYELYVKK